MLHVRFLVAIFICLIFSAAPCWSQNQSNHRISDFDELEQDLDWVQWVVENTRTEQSQLERIRERVQSIMEDARTAGPDAKEAVGSLKKQMDALGSPPGEEEASPESLEVAKKRKELRERLATNEGYLRRIELIETRGKELLNKIAQKESEATAKEILSRDASIFGTEFWRSAATQAGGAPQRIWQLGVSTLSEPRLGTYTITAIVVLTIVLLVRLFLFRLIPRKAGGKAGRYVYALIALVANGILPAAGLVLAFVPLLNSTDTQPPQARFIESILASGAAFLIARAWIHVALFSYTSPRLIKLDRSIADPLSRSLYVLTGAACLSFFLYQMARVEIVEPDFYRSVQLLLRIAIAVLFLRMFPIISDAMHSTHETGAGSSAKVIQGMYGTLFFVAWIAIPSIVVINPILFMGGYWKLADWLFFGVVGSGLLLLTLWLIRSALRQFVARRLPSLRKAESQTDFGPLGWSIGAIVWSVGLFNLVLWLGAIVCLFLIWGIPYSQIKTWTNTILFTEVSLARIEISAFDILVAIGVFVGLVILTKLVQRQLQNRVLSWAPLDIGVRNALWSATGYIGILGASVASLMVLGVNLSQLFLILGALSVGIGFGLQSVVHDFISGLILLLERPVRIGDWIEVRGKEGVVQRIGARASLVKTADEGDLWIPNSGLTSTQVTNWTLASRRGHIRLDSALHTDTDENEATELILKVASKHENIAASPRPDVLMEKADGEAIVLTLHAVVSDISDRSRTESDLRFSLRDAFREAGISYARQGYGNKADSELPRTATDEYALNHV